MFSGKLASSKGSDTFVLGYRFSSLLFAAMLALPIFSAQARLIREYTQPIVFYEEQVGPMRRSTSWSAACQEVAPPCYGSGHETICYEGGGGGFHPEYGPGCSYTLRYLVSGEVFQNWFAQNWVIPRSACPDYSWFLNADGLCERAIFYEKDVVCPVSNPVYPSDGTKRQQENDFSLFSYGKRIDFARNYHTDALMGYSTTFGWGWTLTPWSRSLTLIKSASQGVVSEIVAIRDGGRARYLSPSTGGIWIATPEDGISVVQSGSDWLLKDATTGMIEQYNPEGRLVSLTEKEGRTYSLEYSTSSTSVEIAPKQGLLIRVTGADGKAIHLYYDISAKLIRAETGDILLATYAYETERQELLSSVVYADASRRTYLYENANSPLLTVPGETELLNGLNAAGVPDPQQANPSTEVSHFKLAQFVLGRRNRATLTGIIDENHHRYATYIYDEQGRVAQSQHAGGVESYAFRYDAPLQQTSEIDPLGTERVKTFSIVNGVLLPSGVSQPGGSGCGPASSAISYDENGNVASRTDFVGRQTCYAYDLTRNLETRRVEGLAAGADCVGALSAPPAPTAANPVRTISSQWHPDWRLETRRAEPKKLTTWVYNGQPDPTNANAVTSCAPSVALLPDGKPIAVLCKRIEQATTDATGATGFGATNSGSARIWSWTYNNVGQVLTENGPRTDVTDRTTYAYYASTDFSNPAAGRTKGDLWKTTNAIGHVTEHLAYDKNGRLLKSKDPNGLITTLSYTSRGWLKTRQVGDELTTYDYDAVGQLKKVTQPDGHWIGYDYDAAHRLTDLYDKRGNRIRYTLDNAGNIVRVDAADPAGTLKRFHSRVYDALGRLQNLVQPQ
jgi:YD repeat-containing protein